SNIQLSIFKEAEAKLANLAKAPAALTLSSGTLAGQIVVRYLQSKAPFFYAPGTHPALWGTAVPNKLSFNNWVDQFLSTSEQLPASYVIFANAIDPLFLAQYHWEWLAELPKEKALTLVLDDSHGLGLIGKYGEGVYSSIPPFDFINPIVVASLGKAVGIPGGVIFAPPTTLTAIQSAPFFGGASPPPPAYLQAFLKAELYYEAARKRLQSSIRQFRSQTGAIPAIRYLDNYPVFYVNDQNLADYLAKQHILISSFPYPSPNDPTINRIVLNSLHEAEDLAYLIKFVKSYFNSTHNFT
ncbi:MAG: aminotransferase class I/II-fold pyridoxal phosphate-dependent enzyme, partial [Bacteroidota bacterium]